uniref:Uncharacterized protein n=1 Tax=Brassica oleracea TaxID=3712 RepID=A0A3P6FTC8_BRAOL|nr:unnamed protein product [Brassica oleracea]
MNLSCDAVIGFLCTWNLQFVLPIDVLELGISPSLS